MLYRHLLFHALRATMSRTTTLNFLLSNFLEDRHEGGRSLAPGRHLHLSPGKFKGRNFYLRTIPTLLVCWRQLCHCTRPLDSSYSTPPASKSPAPIMDLGAQDQQKNPKSEGLQWDLGILELDLRFRGGLGLSPIGLENFRGGLSPSPPLNLKSNSKILKSNWT